MAGLIKVCVFRSNRLVKCFFLYENLPKKAATLLIFHSLVRQFLFCA